MTTTPEPDPFAGIEDHPELSAGERRNIFLTKALRGYVPIRKTFVQRPRDSPPQKGRPSPRASVLYDFVNGRNLRALRLLFQIHAFQPILEGDPMKLGVWAESISFSSSPCTPAGARKAMDTLEEMRLITVSGSSHRPVLTLLREDGSGEPWTRPGLDVMEKGPGYFALPHAFWTKGYAEKLKMPGLAMLLIMLAETQDPKKRAFRMAHEHAPEWYGISERTAERGYGELSRLDLTAVKVVKERDINHPAGRREIYYRALKNSFSTHAREELQEEAKKAARAKEVTS